LVTSPPAASCSSVAWREQRSQASPSDSLFGCCIVFRESRLHGVRL
jgi:hypothetical protein